MPSARIAADKLPQFSAAVYEEVCRHLDATDALKIGMRIPIQTIGEQAGYRIAAINTRGQAYRVQNDQVY
jgi:hypothetical protein